MKNMNTILEHLKNAGWYPDRKVNIDREIDALQKRGYTISNTFKEFYQEFGGLKLKIKVEGNERSIHFNIHIPVRWDYDDVIRDDYPKIIGCNSLVPVGNINGSTYLAITEDSFIFSFTDGDVMKIGKGQEAVENLLSKNWRQFEEFPIPDWWGE
jgi:hypothetical protein